jgi:signal transduction histidine kinase
VVNAVKHGRAGRISIGLDSAADEIVLTIKDDGTGPPETTQSMAQDTEGGLRAMAYRADLIGATFNMERLPTRGTRLTCVLPLTGGKNAAKN